MSTSPPFPSGSEPGTAPDPIHPTQKLPSREAVNSLVERVYTWFVALPATNKAIVVGCAAVALLSMLSLLLRLITLLVGLLVLGVVLFLLYRLFLSLYQAP